MDTDTTDKQRIFLMALDAFKSTDLPFVALMGDGQYGIDVESIGLRLWLTSLIETTAAAPQSQWPDHIESWLAGVNDALAQGPPTKMDASQVHGRIRTRLYPVDQDPAGLSYARPFAPGLVLGLALDSPTSVTTVTTDLLASLPLSIDELFVLGQANTDAEPIEETEMFEDRGCHLLSGSSYFIATRVANVPALMAEQIGPAPFGVAFGVPDRHTVLYKVIEPENWGDIIGITSVMDQVTGDDTVTAESGGVLSPLVYYWAPDGRIEVLGGWQTNVNGEAAMTIRPGSAFGHWVRGGVH